MASASILFPAAAVAAATAAAPITRQSLHLSSKLPLRNLPHRPILKDSRPPTARLHVSSPTNKPLPTAANPFFDGGAHYGDLIANLRLGFTFIRLPLTLAAVSSAFNSRYSTGSQNLVISGLTDQDQSDFCYNVIKDVQVVPRFVGEWGDIVIALKDRTEIDVRT